MNEELKKEIEKLVSQCFKETQRLVNRLAEVTYELAEKEKNHPLNPEVSN